MSLGRSSSHVGGEQWLHSADAGEGARWAVRAQAHGLTPQPLQRGPHPASSAMDSFELFSKHWKHEDNMDTFIIGYNPLYWTTFRILFDQFQKESFKLDSWVWVRLFKMKIINSEGEKKPTHLFTSIRITQLQRVYEFDYRVKFVPRISKGNVRSFIEFPSPCFLKRSTIDFIHAFVWNPLFFLSCLLFSSLPFLPPFSFLTSFLLSFQLPFFASSLLWAYLLPHHGTQSPKHITRDGGEREGKIDHLNPVPSTGALT